MKRLKRLAQRAYANSAAKGFWDPNVSVSVLMQALKVALIFSEVAEMLEALRKPGDLGHIDGLPLLNEECADVAIRLLDFCEAYDIDLDDAIRQKMAFNESRPRMHGGKVF